jgi:hypothetical protein
MTRKLAIRHTKPPLDLHRADALQRQLHYTSTLNLAWPILQPHRFTVSHVCVALQRLLILGILQHSGMCVMIHQTESQDMIIFLLSLVHCWGEPHVA